MDVSSQSGCVRLHLDDDVKYMDGFYDHMNIRSVHTANDNRVNRDAYNAHTYKNKYIEINNYETRYKSSEHHFSKSDLKIIPALACRVRTNMQINKDREEYKISKGTYKELKGLFPSLEIQNKDKNQEIKKKEDEVKELREKLDSSRERNLEHEVKDEDTKLEKRIKKLGIDRKKNRELGKLYRNLIRIREDDYDQEKIDEINDKITVIKDEIREEILDERKISTDDIQEFFDKCENLAKLKREHEKVLKQNYQYRT